ncbi:hypothetical protein Tco_0657385 [Tanacetum coccineum]|uniref:C2H2-type domain-containing protein n=1 Tax=Tanacetum coccineum TaxID=301880 RepID=A0ABQ4XBM1_9ASTR
MAKRRNKHPNGSEKTKRPLLLNPTRTHPCWWFIKPHAPLGVVAVVALEEVMIGNGYHTKGQKESQKRQNQARNGKDKVKSKPKSVEFKKSTGKTTPTKSKVIQVEKIQREGLKLPNLKLYYKNKKTRAEIANCKGVGVDNRRITLIVIRARANSAVVVSLMEFVLVVLMEMEIKSIFQLRTLLINLQPFINPRADYSLDFNSPQDLHNLQQQNLCCENSLQANSNAIESLPPSHISVADNDSLMEEIDLFLADDGSIPPGIESDDDNSVDDDTSISLPEFESFYVDYPNSGNSTIDVVEDIPVDVPNVFAPPIPSWSKISYPLVNFSLMLYGSFSHFLLIRLFRLLFSPVGMKTPYLIPAFQKYHSSRPDDCPDCEDSQFCHSSRVSHLQLHLGIRYPNLID